MQVRKQARMEACRRARRKVGKTKGTETEGRKHARREWKQASKLAIMHGDKQVGN